MQNAISVTELNKYIQGMIDPDPFLSRVVVKGEISNFVNHVKTGHFYLSLKDENSIIRAVMFRSDAQKLKFLPENGMKVFATGKVRAFVRDGQYQLYISDVAPDGIGALYIALEQLKKRLEAEGLFRQARPLPKYPARIGIITSPTGAAIRDMIHVSGRRFPLSQLVLYPSLVQGDGAPAQLIAGLRFFNEEYPVDVIILGRGGGSLEELWAFNDEGLARAIVASRIPVISAVGHETDFSISDYAADYRAPTPSAAAEVAVPESGEVKRKLHNVIDRMSLVTENRLHTLRARVDTLARTRQLSSMDNLIEDRRMAVANLDRSMEFAMERKLQAAKALLMQKAAALDALSPLAVMTRGYSALFSPDGKAVRSVKTIQPGDQVKVRLSDGEAIAEIQEVRSHE